MHDVFPFLAELREHAAEARAAAVQHQRRVLGLVQKPASVEEVDRKMKTAQALTHIAHRAQSLYVRQLLRCSALMN